MPPEPRTSLLQPETPGITRPPPSVWTVVLLRDIDGLDTDETAQALSNSRGVVKTRLHRAHRALRSLLAPLFRGGNV